MTSRDQSSAVDNNPLIANPSPAEFKPILPPTMPASVKLNVSSPSGSRVWSTAPSTSGIQSQFSPSNR